MEGLVDRYVAGGMSEEEARRRTRRRFVDPDATRAELAAKAWRARRRTLRRELADSFIQDLRMGLRQMRRRPGFAAVVILTLGLGIGANSAVFSVLRSVVLTPLPYPEPDRLMTVWTPWEGYRFNPLSAPDWADLRDGSRSFQAWGVYESHSLNLSGDGEPEEVTGIRLSASVFRALGAETAQGRLFLPAETGAPGARVAVVSHGLWQRRFGSDPHLLGRGILINQEPWTVIGILPKEFRFPDWGGLTDPDVYLPVLLDPATADRGSYYLRVLGRLGEGRSREQAQDELGAIAARLAATYPETNGHRVVQVVPLREIVLGDSPDRLWILLGVTGLILLLACSNVAGLLVARNLGRGAELAVRASLGAGRHRLTRQLLTETLALALLGGGAGLLLAWRGTDLLTRILPASLLAGAEIRVDGLVVSATLGATVLTTLLTGVIPALVAPLEGSASTLRDGSRTFTPSRARGRVMGFMVVAQLALAFVLVDGAGLMLQSLRKATALQELDDPGQVLVAGYLQTREGNDQIILPDSFLEELLRRLRGIPGVRKAGATTTLPLQGLWTSDILAEGEAYDPDADVPSTHMVPVSDGYFEAMGIGLLAGRDLAPEDLTEGALGVVVNESFATRHWPGEVALGKRIRANAPSDPWLEAVVVGVVEDVRQRGLETPAEGSMYLPFFPPFQTSRWVAIRTVGDPLSLVPTLRQTFSELDPNRPLTQVFTAEDLYERAARGRSSTTLIFGMFALVALALAAAGTFGVMSFSARQRFREMGVRIALGATRGEVVWLLLRMGLTLSIVGTGIGLLGVLGASRILESLLYGVGSLNPVFMVASGVTLGIVAAAAAGLPAFRASRVDPVEVIRSE
jgi:putative ABC transport system permease protein